MADHDPTGLLAMTTGIIANFVANNRVTPDELPRLVATVHDSLSQLGDEPKIEAGETHPQPTAVQIRKSITDDGIISFIDGKKYQSMKRHLTRNGMTPEEYRARFGLPSNYAMTSAAYSAKRSALAKAAGLGQGGRQPKNIERAVRKPRAPKA